MGLLSAGVTPGEVSVAVKNLVHNYSELPTVADVVDEVERIRTDTVVAALRCPKCSSDLVAAVDGRVVLCFECDWEAGAK